MYLKALNISNLYWSYIKITLAILLIACCKKVGFTQDYKTAIEKAQFLLQKHQQQTNTPGIQVALMIGDSLIWSAGFGYSDIENQTAVDHTTRFRVASVSKSITSVALGKLMENDKINIDKDIRYYLPEFPEKEYTITSRQLAASTSGIRHYEAKDPTYNAVNYPDIIASLERFKNDNLLFKPDSQYHYSSYGWVLLSAVMERAAEQSFFQLMEETWAEMGMLNTTFDYPEKETDHISKFYIHDKIKGRAEAPADNRTYMYAGGGYLSTAEDLAKMGSMLMEETYLKKNTTEQLFKSHELSDGTETHYGLGWEVGISRMGTRVVYHSGSLSTARSHLVMYPEEKIVFAYLTNTGDQIFFNDREAHSIAEIFLNAKRANSTSLNMSDVTGSWEIATTSLRNKKSKGTLNLKMEDGNLVGTLDFKRSRKKKEFPIVLTEIRDSVYHFVAVSPMFIDLYIHFDGNSFKGKWLHDFNVKGVPEEDEYWGSRVITGKKTDN